MLPNEVVHDITAAQAAFLTTVRRLGPDVLHECLTGLLIASLEQARREASDDGPASPEMFDDWLTTLFLIQALRPLMLDKKQTPPQPVQ